MKRYLAILGLLALFVFPVLAQAQAPVTPLPTFFVLAGTGQKDSGTGRIIGHLDLGMGHDLTPSQRAGLVMTFLSTANTSGGAAGGYYEYVAWEGAKHDARLILGGKGEATFGGAASATDLLGVASIGYEHEHKGLRAGLFVEATKPLSNRPTESAPVNDFKQVAVTLKLSFLKF